MEMDFYNANSGNEYKEAIRFLGISLKLGSSVRCFMSTKNFS